MLILLTYGVDLVVFNGKVESSFVFETEWPKVMKSGE